MSESNERLQATKRAAIRARDRASKKQRGLEDQVERQAEEHTYNIDALSQEIAKANQRLQGAEVALQEANERGDTFAKENSELANEVETLKIQLESVLVDRTAKYLESDSEGKWEFWGVLRPDQLKDAEQALMMSQKAQHTLREDMDAMRSAYAADMTEAKATEAEKTSMLSVLESTITTQQGLLSSFLSTIEVLVQDKTTGNLQAVYENIRKSAQQNNELSTALLAKSLAVVKLEAEQLRVSGQHERAVVEIESDLRASKAEKMAEEIAHYSTKGDLSEAKEKIDRLARQVADTEGAFASWRDGLRERASEGQASTMERDIISDYGVGQIKHLEDRLQFYVDHASSMEQDIQRLESEQNLWHCTVRNELEMANQWRFDKNLYRNMCKAYEERFAPELFVRPLEFPVHFEGEEPNEAERRRLEVIEQHLRDIYRIDRGSGVSTAQNMPTESEYERMFQALKIEEEKRVAEEEAKRRADFGYNEEIDDRAWIYEDSPVDSPAGSGIAYATRDDAPSSHHSQSASPISKIHHNARIDETRGRFDTNRFDASQEAVTTDHCGAAWTKSNAYFSIPDPDLGVAHSNPLELSPAGLTLPDGMSSSRHGSLHSNAQPEDEWVTDSGPSVNDSSVKDEDDWITESSLESNSYAGDDHILGRDVLENFTEGLEENTDVSRRHVGRCRFGGRGVGERGSAALA